MNFIDIHNLMTLREDTSRKVLLYLFLCGTDPVFTTHGKISFATDLTRNQVKYAIGYLESKGFISVSSGKNETSISIIGIRQRNIYEQDDDINRIIVELGLPDDQENAVPSSNLNGGSNSDPICDSLTVPKTNDTEDISSIIINTLDCIEGEPKSAPKTDLNNKSNSEPVIAPNTFIGIDPNICPEIDSISYPNTALVEGMHNQLSIANTRDIGDINGVPNGALEIELDSVPECAFNSQEFADNAVVTTSQRKEPKENEYIYITNSQSLESNPEGLDKEIGLKKETSKERNPILDAIKAEAIPKKQAAMLYEYYMEKLRGGTRAKAVDKIEDLLCGTHFIAKNKQYSPQDLISSIDSYAEDIKDMDKRIVYRPEYFFGRDLIFTAYLPGANLDKAFLENKEAALVQRNDAIEIHALYARHLRNDTRPHDAIKHIERILAGSHEKCQGKPVPKDNIIEAVLAYSRNKRGTEKKYIHAPCNFFGTKGVVFDWLENKNGVHHEVAPYEEPDVMKNRIEIVL